MIKTILTTIAILIRMPFTNRIGIGSFLEKFEEARIYVYLLICKQFTIPILSVLIDWNFINKWNCVNISFESDVSSLLILLFTNNEKQMMINDNDVILHVWINAIQWYARKLLLHFKYYRINNSFSFISGFAIEA